MASIKKQFSDMRASTPKHIQWLLLAAAFVVVLILLTLLWGKRESNNTPATELGEIKLELKPADDTIDWSDTVIGTTKTQKIEISATAPVKILNFRTSGAVAGLETPLSNCKKVAFIGNRMKCELTLSYKPTAVADAQSVAFNIDWRPESMPDKMQQSTTITLKLGATAAMVDTPAPVATPTPTPTIAAEPKSDPAPAPTTAPEPAMDTPDITPAPAAVENEITSTVKEIAPAVTFDDEIDDAPIADIEPITTTSKPAPAAGDMVPTRAESCSDFAFPGYGPGGNQIGWIKPDGGAYYFHPFSDKECKNPTGVYNPNTGLITDINTPSKRIGTDAEHIGQSIITGGKLPELTNRPAVRPVNRAQQKSAEELSTMVAAAGLGRPETFVPKVDTDTQMGTTDGGAVFSSDPYDRSFVLRQYKPIPATIVSEIRADPSLYENQKMSLPVRATVDRNVYSDNGRNIIIPAGTLLLGYLTGTIPGPYKSIGRMDISWYQFVLPNGVEFNFTGEPNQDPFSGDAQGRQGVTGRGSTDYLEQLVMPMLTAIVPAAVNMIAPISDKFVNQIDLDNNTVVQSGTVRSSELAKNEIVTAWNAVAQKLLVDMMENTVPPFSIAAGTRITVYSPTDLVMTCGSHNEKCSVATLGGEGKNRNIRAAWSHKATATYDDGTWVGQSRSFEWQKYCSSYKDGKLSLSDADMADLNAKGISYNNVLFYCQTNQYKAINNAKQEAIYNQQKTQFDTNYNISSTGMGVDGNANIIGDQKYNEDILGLTYDDAGLIEDPFADVAPVEEVGVGGITCEDGTMPDANGCCTGEIYTDMGDQGFNCCPSGGGDCFPPIL